MADLVSIVPELDTTAFKTMLPSLEKASISCADLLVFDAIEVRKRTGLLLRDICILRDAVVRHLQESLHLDNLSTSSPRIENADTFIHPGFHTFSGWQTVSTLDSQLDKALGGGFPTRYLSEITGESGAGKTQLLLTLLLSVQLPAPHGLSKAAVYISTEGGLQTGRLFQISQSHEKLSSLSPGERPDLSRIFSIKVPDLEAQDHILQYQLPVMIKTHNIGLIVIDSITANYRAEFDRAGGGLASTSQISSYHRQPKRAAQIVKVGALLRNLARTKDIAIVVANQVSDRFNPELESSLLPPHKDRPHLDLIPPRASDSSVLSFQATRDTMSLDHQQRWFTGWGERETASGLNSNLKTPTLGLIWANQIACRVVIVRETWPTKQTRAPETGTTAHTHPDKRRLFKVVFAPWIATLGTGANREFEGIEVVITAQGIANASMRNELEK